MTCCVCTASRCRLFADYEGRSYWRCEECFATFLDPSMHPTPEVELREYRFHQNDPADLGYRRFIGEVVMPLLERLTPKSRGLDFGCGPGSAFAAMMREAGHSVALYDPFFCNDVEALEQTYDFIACTEVIEHFHQPAAEFAKLNELLKPGGWLALMTCFQRDDSRFEHWHYRRDPTHVVFYKQETLQFLARRFGWTCEFPRKNVALMHRPPFGRLRPELPELAEPQALS